VTTPGLALANGPHVKLATIARITRSLIGLVAIAASLVITPGGAKDGDLRQTLGAPEGASKDEAAYDLGWPARTLANSS
jgi:hypothetical protein